MNIADELGKVYEMLQGLQVQPTEHNLRILVGVLDTLKACWQELNRTAPGVRVVRPEEGESTPPEAIVIRPAREAGEG